MSSRQNNTVELMTLVDLHVLKIALAVIALEQVGDIVISNAQRVMLLDDVGGTPRAT
jgi:hypothetical protein